MSRSELLAEWTILQHKIAAVAARYDAQLGAIQGGCCDDEGDVETATLVLEELARRKADLFGETKRVQIELDDLLLREREDAVTLTAVKKQIELFEPRFRAYADQAVRIAFAKIYAEKIQTEEPMSVVETTKPR